MARKSIQRLLIANRREIAVRIIRACRELGITSIAVYSDVDRRSMHVRMADAAFPLGGVVAGDTYLHQDKILEIAKKSRADAIHPGYGFLSENPGFADRVEREGFLFVGPGGDVIRSLGDKTEARTTAKKLGIPVVPGTMEPLANDAGAIRIAQRIGFPVLLKAAAGGGGKGMRVVTRAKEFPSLLRAARSEAKSAFGDDRVYLEKYVENPRHIEIQLLADHNGDIVHLGERECSIQRRHQKVIEESPSPIVDESMRREMGDAAVTLAKHVGYANAGTIEFLVDETKSFYFLEMNTRLQVEHPVTEQVTGIDLVRQQIRISEGERIPFSQKDIRRIGHALECRIYAEDPANEFLPSTGKLLRYVVPQGGNVRVDNGFVESDDVSVYYDPMIAKVITWGNTRTEAIDTMKRALHEYEIEGVESTIPFCLFVLDHPGFIRGEFATGFVETYFLPTALRAHNEHELKAAALAAALLKTRSHLQMNRESNHSSQQRSQWKNLRTETHRS